MSNKDSLNLEIIRAYLEEMNLPSFFEHQTWDNMNNRILTINSFITDNIVEEIILPIFKYNKEDEGIPVADRKIITLYLNTVGGQEIGFTLCDVIRNSKTPIHCIVLSKALSMGIYILISAHYRSAYNFSIIMMHDGDLDIKNSIKKARETMGFITKTEEGIKEFVINNSKITNELYDKMYGSEWYLTSRDALELGIIDNIIGE